MKRFVQITVLGVLLAVAPNLRASEVLRNEMSKLADAVLGTVGEKGSVKVGVFSFKNAKDMPNNNSEIGIELLLTQELEAKRKGSVQANAPYEVNGEYKFVKPTESATSKVLKIVAKVYKAETDQQVNTLPMEVSIQDNKSIAKVIQPTTYLPPNGSYEERNKKIEESAKNPSVVINGTQVSSTKGSPYSVEIRVKPLDKYNTEKAQARKPHEEKGQAFVDIARGEVYEVIVHNNSGKEVAVGITIDGIDQFHFSKDRDGNGRPAFSYWIMRKDQYGKVQELLRVPGWFNTAKDPKNTYLSFLVVGYGQGAVSELGIKARGKVGVIHVSFYETYPLVGGKPKSGDETGKGPPVGGQVEAVQYGVGAQIDSVAIRYTREQQ